MILPSTDAQAVFDFDSTLQKRKPSFKVPASCKIRLSSGHIVRLNPEFTGPRNGDTLSTLFDALGPRHPDTREPMRFTWEREQRAGIITNEELLRRQVEAVLKLLTVNQAIELAATMLEAMPGARAFFRALRKADFDIVIVSGGCDRLQGGLMERYFPGLEFSLHANILEGKQQRALHPPVGVDKGKVVATLSNPLLFCGDAEGDIPGVIATAERGGIIFCLADALARWCEQHLHRDQWVQLQDYRGAMFFPHAHRVFENRLRLADRCVG
jgi:2-hydroxy-3-keto-5-methylthiopentenyl-1-phosphate phosphatase